jgi:MoCo/4Fe-4S cofactor protein with predicted Tat translocation signal
LKTHWRSLAELNDLPEFRAFAEAEFPEVADPGGINRRRWLQIMGASMALAGVAGCETEKQELLPFAKRPDGRTPGKPQQFATAMDLSGSAIGLLVTCVDGRPVKVEGNPQHPQSLGASHAHAQAAILELYDPDRSQQPVHGVGQSEVVHFADREKDQWSAYDEFARGHFATVREKLGAGFAVLSEANSSPTIARLRTEMLEAMPQARWVQYEPLTDDNVRAGAVAALGKPYRTQLDLASAKVTVCLDADLLGSHPASLRYARDFATGRDVADGKMNRLYVVESDFSITGSAADHRLPLRSGEIAAFLGRLQEKIAQLASTEDGIRERVDSQLDKFVAAVAADLVEHRGQSIVAVGPRQPAAVHAAVHQLNAMLQNVGKTVRYTLANADEPAQGQVEQLKALAADLQAGSITTLLVLGGNPVYDAPADLDFASGLKQVKHSIHVGLYRNETALACGWHLPQAHFLESWGDARSFDGTYSVIQPMVAPLYDGRSWAELVAGVLGETLPKSVDLVRETFQAIAGDRYSEPLWRKTVHDGLLADSAWPAQSVDPQSTEPLPTNLTEAAPVNGEIELVFCRDTSTYDGRFANNGWLQECPDPLTKLVWDNVAIMSPATAKLLDVTTEAVVSLQVGDQSIEVPVYVLPGQADGSVAIALGYGRTAAGQVGGLADSQVESIGVSAYPLRSSGAMYVVGGVKVSPVGRRYRLASTQDHHAIDTVGMKERARRVGDLIREGSLKHYNEHPDFAQHVVHHPPLESMWSELEYNGHRWGMSIDLSKCIGCTACVVACQAENNIPVVGKDQVARGREMHWIRIDRYFKGDAEHSEDVEVAMQPLACHHCELAPCEQVCPVAATVHSSEGLNDMVYNRCIGTRYCANNCPYKVRRFNYFNYHKELEDANHEISKMMYNPEVTVRSRGVMEKCTYCVQRIQATKIETKNEGQPIQDGLIQTACQQACPTQAIVFGDLADKTSQVSMDQEDDRAYAILAELNVKPRTMYMAKIRNPSPHLVTESEDSEH